MTKQKVLIVEDEVYIAQQISAFVEALDLFSMGYVTSGEDALEFISKDIPDLILMDIVLDENGNNLDGIKTTQIINKSHDIPIIFITAYKDDITINKAVDVEPYGYITKPITDARDIKATIEIALRKHKTRKESERKLDLIEKIFNDENKIESPLATISNTTEKNDRKKINFADSNVESWFNALGNIERLKIIVFLLEGSKQFDQIVIYIEKVKSTVSHHLSILERMGIISVTRKRITSTCENDSKRQKNGLVTQYSLGNIPTVIDLVKTADIEILSKSLSCLGSKERLSIVENLTDNIMQIDDFKKILKKSESTISRHLRILLNNEIISAEKKGRSTLYSINEKNLFKILDTFQDYPYSNDNAI